MSSLFRWFSLGVWKCFRAFIFKWDAESAHRFTVGLVRFISKFGHRPIVLMSGSQDLIMPPPSGKFPTFFGLEFQNKVGLAAGFDKDCEILPVLPDLGFGFAEIGTVTPLPQEGNPRPRLFRDLTQESLFNRMGFNGKGADVVSARLAQVRHKLPNRFRVGVNLGKNKSTPPELAAKDYTNALRPFEGLADYVVVNVSSPNTPGLRALQTSESLKPIVDSLMQLTAKWQSAPPLLLKLAPELSEEELSVIIVELEKTGIAGWVLTNTLAGSYEQLPGGWSGKVLAPASRASLKAARSKTIKPIISVGGIHSEQEAVERIRLGADLIQIYTGWIYGGPAFPAKIARILTKN